MTLCLAVQGSARTASATKNATRRSPERTPAPVLESSPEVIANAFAVPARRGSSERLGSPRDRSGDAAAGVFANKYALEPGRQGDEVAAYLAEVDACVGRIDTLEADMERQPRVAARRHSEIEVRVPTADHTGPRPDPHRTHIRPTPDAHQDHTRPTAHPHHCYTRPTPDPHQTTHHFHTRPTSDSHRTHT